MGFSGDLGFDSDHQKKWVIAGIQLRAPLKPIYTVAEITDGKHGDRDAEEEEEEQEECGSITPKAAEARIPARVTCPPPPRKRKPAAKKCNYGRVREFFTPPDLESVFIRHVET